MFVQKPPFKFALYFILSSYLPNAEVQTFEKRSLLVVVVAKNGSLGILNKIFVIVD